MAEKDYIKILYPRGKENYPYAGKWEENWRFIDTIDFIPIIKSIENIRGEVSIDFLMRMVDEMFDKKDLPACCEETSVFNCVSDYEFAEYLANRYDDISTYERTTYFCSYNGE